MSHKHNWILPDGSNWIVPDGNNYVTPEPILHLAVPDGRLVWTGAEDRIVYATDSDGD
jgi:hypothetical protein